MTSNGTDYLGPDLAAFLTSPPLGRPRRRVFAGHPDQVVHARRFVRRSLPDSPAAGDAALLTSELAANAIQHTASAGLTFEVVICQPARNGTYRRYRCWCPTIPAPAPAGSLDPSGRRGSRWSKRWPANGASRETGTAAPSGLKSTAHDRPHPPSSTPAQDTTTTGPGPASPRPTRLWTTVLDGERLRLLRHQRGLSQEQLAAQAGISLATIGRLERQHQAPCRCRTLARLAAALQTEPATLVWACVTT